MVVETNTVWALECSIHFRPTWRRQAFFGCPIVQLCTMRALHACCKYTLKMEDLQYACHLPENLQIRKSLDELGEMHQICRSGNWRSEAASEKGCQNHKCKHLNNISDAMSQSDCSHSEIRTYTIGVSLPFLSLLYTWYMHTQVLVLLQEKSFWAPLEYYCYPLI